MSGCAGGHTIPGTLGEALSWFHEIIRNPYIDVALLVDGAGRLVATSNRIGSEAQRVASMIKAAEVLARGLSAELGRGEVRSLQLSTKGGHVLVLPVGAAHYLIVLTGKEAPLEVISTDMQRLLVQMPEEDLTDLLQTASIEDSPLDDLDIHELIDAVTQWLHDGGDPTHI